MTAAWGTPVARRALAAAVLGSGVAFLDGTIVNVALPAIGRDLDAGLSGLQWVLDAYLVTLTALLLLGGALGDRYGRRRVFLFGIYVFAAASVSCGLAPTTELLVAARAVQGAGGALLVPGSLALLTATIAPADRARAVGAWSGLTGVASAIGPLLGGWLVDAASWRWAFFLNLPLTLAVVLVARGIPESVDVEAAHHIDVSGAVTAVGGLVLLTAGLIGAGDGWSAMTIGACVAGGLLLVGFVVVERRTHDPMLPLGLFASAQFTGANLVTLAVYAGLGAAFFLVVVNLQVALGYSALEAGVAMLPVTLLMLVLSSHAGALAQRIGPRLPMTVGPLLVAAGLLWLGQVGPGDRYLSAVLPAVLVFGLGLSTTVAPLTAAVMAAVDEHHLGVGSAVNNAVARLAGLLAVAVLPSVAGVELAGSAGGLPGYGRALGISAALCVAGGTIAAVTIRRGRPTEPTIQASVLQPCHGPDRVAA
ncbi:MAG: transporter [Actinomycetia bacterium]|nr:transporter [Actinomycetes bacterium]